MDKSLFLVADFGERHEDCIPVGIFDSDHIRKNFILPDKMDDVGGFISSDTNLNDLDVDEWHNFWTLKKSKFFSSEDIAFFKKHGYIEDDPENENGYVSFQKIVKIVVNSEIPKG